MYSMLINILIGINISGAVIILSAALFARDVTKLGAFPSALIILTVLRLAGNLIITYSILALGEAGGLAERLGYAVLGGNMAAGFTIFVVLVVVNFFVIIKSAARVSGIAAKTEPESEFISSVNGAMYFIKADAIMMPVFIIVNLTAGSMLAVAGGTGFGEAFSVYTRVTVGAGVAAQVPALLVLIAAGMAATQKAAAKKL
jgi:flagellar biosynthesis protein FlhA